MKSAYYGYKEWVKSNGQEKKLPGLAYTPEQLFYIAHASPWYTTNNPEKFTNRSSISAYNTPEMRVNLPLMNFEDFSRDFNCPIGSVMNPIKKCIIW